MFWLINATRKVLIRGYVVNFRSGQKIAPLYLEYEAADDEDDQVVEFMEEDDDFLNDHNSPGIASPTRHSDRRFSYGTSPGFRYKS